MRYTKEAAAFYMEILTAREGIKHGQGKGKKTYFLSLKRQ